ncbi:MAG: hypothetical protein JW395_1282 [Nitrospira sp.]|nr:hypothetical protein [Nitrospira sp.]
MFPQIDLLRRGKIVALSFLQLPPGIHQYRRSLSYNNRIEDLALRSHTLECLPWHRTLKRSRDLAEVLPNLRFIVRRLVPQPLFRPERKRICSVRVSEGRPHILRSGGCTLRNFFRSQHTSCFIHHFPRGTYLLPRAFRLRQRNTFPRCFRGESCALWCSHPVLHSVHSILHNGWTEPYTSCRHTSIEQRSYVFLCQQPATGFLNPAPCPINSLPNDRLI